MHQISFSNRQIESPVSVKPASLLLNTRVAFSNMSVERFRDVLWYIKQVLDTEMDCYPAGLQSLTSLY